MCVVIPYPSLRHRRDLIERHARMMASFKPAAAERHLQRQLKIKRDVMLRQSVAPDLIAKEISGMEAAIRAELWHLVMSHGGAR